MGRHQPHLLVSLAAEGDRIDLDQQTSHHLSRVLRYPEGGKVTYTDGTGLLGVGSLESGAVVRGDERTLSRTIPLTVAVAPPHEMARVRFVVEKLGELGVDRLLWLWTARGEGRAPRVDKIRAWARAALEQSRGVWLMNVGEEVAVPDVGRWGTPVFAELGGVAPVGLGHIADPVLCVGPEGGFAPGEIPDGAAKMHLGDTVLRVETAAVVGAAILRACGGPDR